MHNLNKELTRCGFQCTKISDVSKSFGRCIVPGLPDLVHLCIHTLTEKTDTSVMQSKNETGMLSYLGVLCPRA